MLFKCWCFGALVVAITHVAKCEECSLPPDNELSRHGCNRNDLLDWASSDFPLRGYHIVCVAPSTTLSTSVMVFKEGQPSSLPQIGQIRTETMSGFRDDLASLCGVGRHLDPWHDAGKFFQLCRNENERCQEWASRGECELNPDYMTYDCAGSCGTCNTTEDRPVWSGQPWRLFETRSGNNDPVVSLSEIIREGGMFLLFEGGQFIWPGVRPGFRRPVVLGGKRVVIETLALQPLVLEVESFLADEECDHVIAEAAPSMAKSKVALMDKDKGKADAEFRTSSTFFLPSRTPTLKAVDDRVASLTRVPRQHQEYVQVLRYEEGQYYGSHHDFWDPDFYQSEEWLKMSEGGFTNRLATVFWYMTDVPKGGETNFPRAHGGPDLANTNANCGTRGLSVRPAKGKVIVFYSLRPDGSGDTFSLHSACPVKEGGLKWAANKWVWNTPKGFIA